MQSCTGMAKLRSNGGLWKPNCVVMVDILMSTVSSRQPCLLVGLNARGRLDALKQTKSVDTYIDAFNSIASNAVDNPIVGAEACYFFQKGLKDSISSLLLKNSSIGGLGEFGDVAELAARAKALDAHLHEHKRQCSVVVAEEGVFQDVKGRGKAKVVGGRRHHGTKRSAHDQPESSRQVSGSHQSLVCFKCGKLGHASMACTKSQF